MCALHASKLGRCCLQRHRCWTARCSLGLCSPPPNNLSTRSLACLQNAALVPDKLWVSAEKLDSNGMYLLENGYEAWVYVGKAAPAELCMAILGRLGVESSGHRVEC